MVLLERTIKKTLLNASQTFPIIIGSGAVLCLKETDIPISSDVYAIPVGYL